MHCSATSCASPSSSAIANNNDPCKWGKIAFNSWTTLPKNLSLSTTPELAKNAFAANSEDKPFIKLFPDEEPFAFIESDNKVYSSVVKYHKNDTWFYFPRALKTTATEYDKATQISYTIRYRDLSTKTYYVNRTIANFDANGKFVSYDRAPASFATFFPVNGPYADNSYWIDFTAFNNTRRFI